MSWERKHIEQSASSRLPVPRFDSSIYVESGVAMGKAPSSPRRMEFRRNDSELTPDIERSGCLLDTLITMSMTTIGVGTLGLPHSYAKAGIIPSIAFTIFFAVLTNYSLQILVKVAKRTNRYTYEGLAEYYLGFWGTRYCNWALIIQLFFLVVTVFTIPMKNVEALIHDLAYPNIEDVCYNNQTGTPKYTFPDCTVDKDCAVVEDRCFTRGSALNGVCDHTECFCGKPVVLSRFTLGVIVVMFFVVFGMAKTLSGIVAASCVGMLALFCAAGLFCALFFDQLWSDNAEFTHVDLWPRDQNCLWLLGSLILAFNCQFNLLQCYSELRDPEDISKIIYGTVFAVVLPLYLVIGLLGVFLLPADNKQQNAFDALQDSAQATAGKWLLAIMTLAKGALVFNPMRDLIIQEIRQLPLQACRSITKWNVGVRIGVSVLMGLLCYVFAAWFSPQRHALMLIIAVFSSSTAFVIPALFSIRDTNMHGTILAARGEKPASPPGYYPELTMLLPRYKVKYLLAVALLIIGVAGGFVALASEIVVISNMNGTSSVQECTQVHA